MSNSESSGFPAADSAFLRLQEPQMRIIKHIPRNNFFIKQFLSSGRIIPPLKLPQVF